MNIELAQKVLNHIKTHPESFDMRFAIESGVGFYSIDPYPYGTTCCIAGWAVLLSVPGDRAFFSAFVRGMEKGVNWENISFLAQQLLSISKDEAEFLFDFENLSNEDAIAQFESFIEQERMKDEIIENFDRAIQEKERANLIDASVP